MAKNVFLKFQLSIMKIAQIRNSVSASSVYSGDYHLFYEIPLLSGSCLARHLILLILIASSTFIQKVNTYICIFSYFSSKPLLTFYDMIFFKGRVEMQWFLAFLG